MSAKVRRIFLAVLTGLVILAGCQNAPAPAAPAVTPYILRVELTAALADLTPLLSDCARQGSLGLVVNELPTALLERGSAPVRLRWGAPVETAGFAARLADPGLALIVHPDNPLASLTRAQLRAIYSGSARSWGDLPDCSACAASPLAGQEIRAWAYAPGEDIQQLFEAALGQRVQSSAAGLAPHPAAVLEAVSEDPAALGYLPARLVTSAARSITVADIPPEGLTRPILALTAAEPQGPERRWLACVQAGLGN